MNRYRSHLVALGFVLVLTGAGCSPAFAVNKDMVQLETQVQQLQDAVARLQQSNDERMGVLKDLVQQSADSVNRMSVGMETVQKTLQAQQEAQGGKVDQVSGQVQALNDSLDEIKARLQRLEKLMQDVQGQQQSMSASMQGGGAITGAPVCSAGSTSCLQQQFAPIPDNGRRFPSADHLLWQTGQTVRGAA